MPQLKSAAGVLCALVLSALVPSAAHAAQLSVSPTGSDSGNCRSTACKTFSYAYGQAAGGDTVNVGDGVYPDQTVPAGSKAVTFKGDIDGHEIRHLENQSHNVTFDGIVVDGNFEKQLGFHNAGVNNVTYKNGRIGNVADEKGALVSGENFTFDNVLFHDAIMTPEGEAAGVHMECVYAIVVPGMTVRNSTFRDCSVMDLFFTYGTWWSPLPPAYGDVTIENNVFSHPEMSSNAGWHYYGLFVANVGPTGNEPLDGWVVRNNTFENNAAVSRPTGVNSRWVNNIGVWDCVPGVSYSHNVGQACGPTDISVSPGTSSASCNAPFGWVNPAAVDFRLTAGSVAINAGDPTDYPATDRNGAPRDSTPNAGAYEMLAPGSPAGPICTPGGGGGDDEGDGDDGSSGGGSASGPKLLGVQTVGAAVDSIPLGQAQAAPFVASAGGDAASVHLFVDSTSTAAGMRVGIYTNTAADRPGALLAEGVASSLAEGQWNEVTLPAGATITAGQTYWVALLGAGSGTLAWRHDSNASCTVYTSSRNDLTALPATWTVGSGFSLCAPSVFVAPAADSQPQDTTAPDTSITAGPAANTTATTASFSFTATEAASFECKLDAGAWQPCSNPKTYSGLTVGPHTFHVRATDAAENTDSTPAERGWTVVEPPDEGDDGAGSGTDDPVDEGDGGGVDEHDPIDEDDSSDELDDNGDDQLKDAVIKLTKTKRLSRNRARFDVHVKRGSGKVKVSAKQGKRNVTVSVSRHGSRYRVTLKARKPGAVKVTVRFRGANGFADQTVRRTVKVRR